VTAADPDEVRAYPNRSTRNYRQDPGLVIVGTLPEQVTITLRAPRSTWDELTPTMKGACHPESLRPGCRTTQVIIKPQVKVRP